MQPLDNQKISSSPGFASGPTFVGPELEKLRNNMRNSPNGMALPKVPGKVRLIRCLASNKERYVRDNDYKTGKVSHVACCGIDKRAGKGQDAFLAPQDAKRGPKSGVTFSFVDQANTLLSAQASLLSAVKPEIVRRARTVRLDIGAGRHGTSYDVPHEGLQWLYWAQRVIANPTVPVGMPLPMQESRTVHQVEAHWQELRRVLSRLAAEDALRYGGSGLPDFAQAAVTQNYGQAYELSPPSTALPLRLPTPSPFERAGVKPSFLASDLERDTWLPAPDPTSGLITPMPIRLHSLLPGFPEFTADQSRVLVMLWAAQLAHSSGHDQFPLIKARVFHLVGEPHPRVSEAAQPWAVASPPVNPGKWFDVLEPDHSQDLQDLPAITHTGPDGAERTNLIPAYQRRLVLVRRPPREVWVPASPIDAPVADLEAADDLRKGQWREAYEDHRANKRGRAPAYRLIRIPSWPAAIDNLPLPDTLLQNEANFTRNV